MATAADAARERVIQARAELGEELDALEASARAAVDVPAKIRRSPAKVAAVVGGAGFLALRGPQRILGGAKRAVFGAPEPLPDSMLPDEVEKAVRALGKDGTKVRGALERDFASYVKAQQKSRSRVNTALLLGAAQPILTRAAKASAEWLFRTDDEGFQARLARIRDRADRTAQAGADTESSKGPTSG